MHFHRLISRWPWHQLLLEFFAGHDEKNRPEKGQPVGEGGVKEGK